MDVTSVKKANTISASLQREADIRHRTIKIKMYYRLTRCPTFNGTENNGTDEIAMAVF